MADWKSLLAKPGIILADGAMGTMLFSAGLAFGDPPERWNLEHPDRVRTVHRGYLEAGAQLILTNTFGGSRFRLQMHNLQDMVRDLNNTAAALARAEVHAHGDAALVAGDIGPSGAILEPLGDLTFDEAVEGFAEQAAGLINGGVDVLWIETMSDLQEVQAAFEGARQVSSSIPVITTMTFDTRGHTMMGVSPQQAAQTLNGLGAAAIGGNCGNGPEEIIEVIRKMHAESPQAVLVAKANAGIPELIDGRAVYGASPETMAGYARAVAQAGARIIGACCGSTPAHVAAMAAALGLTAGI
jgi:5-methyltetrahydrofolate--homocysteine methyltransferase